MAKRTAAGAVLGGSLLFTGALGIAGAAPVGDVSDGLVNLGVGNTNLLTDVNTGVASKVASLICGANANPMDLDLKTNQVDAGTTATTSCDSAQGMVTITQNGSTPGATPQSDSTPGATPQSGPVKSQDPAVTPGQPNGHGNAAEMPVATTPIG
jgi:hypothetical protein